MDADRTAQGLVRHWKEAYLLSCRRCLDSGRIIAELVKKIQWFNRRYFDRKSVAVARELFAFFTPVATRCHLSVIVDASGRSLRFAWQNNNNAA